MKVKAPSAPEVLCWCRRCWYHLYRPWAQGWGTQSWSSWCCWRRRCRLFSFSSPGQWSRGRWWRYTELQGLTRLNRERNIISAYWEAQQSNLHLTGRRGGGCRRWRASASLSYSASCPAARWVWGPSGWRRRSWHSGSCLSPSCWRWSSASLNQMKYFKFQTPASELCQFTCIVSVSVSLRSDVGAMFVTRLPHSDCSDTAGAGVSPLYLSPLVSLVLTSRHSPRPSTPRSVAQEKVAAHN